MNEIGVAISPAVLRILSRYLPKEQAIEAAKEIEIEMYEARQSLKELIISEFKAVSEPQFTFPGWEKLPANTIGRIDEKYDYSKILKTPIENISWF